MPALHFPTPELLRHLLEEEVVPPEVASAPAYVGFDETGRDWLHPSEPLDRKTLQAVQQLGVLIRVSTEIDLNRPIASWYEWVELVPDAVADERLAREIVFEMPAAEFSSFGSELRRLGARSFSTAGLELPDESKPRIFVRVESPPYYAVARALDPKSPVRAFSRAADGVWVQVGHRHPFVGAIVVPAGRWLLVRAGREWTSLPVPEWTATVAELPLALPETPLRSYTKVRGKMPLTLRLTSQRDADPAELWVIRGNAQEQLKPLIESADERTLERFQVAAVRRDEGESLLLRIPKVKGPQPVWLLPGTAHRAYLKLPNLFLPCRMRLEPVPRRDTLRETFRLDRDRLVWLEPDENGTFRIESVPLSAFQPLRQWVAFEVAEPRQILKSEAIRPFAEPEPFVVATEPAKPRARSETPGEAKQPTPTKPPVKREQGPGVVKRLLGWMSSLVPRLGRSGGREESDAPVESISVETAVKNALRPMEDRLRMPDVGRVSSSQEQLSTLEARFLEGLLKAGGEHRDVLWEELAPAYEKTENLPDAVLSWINAVWYRDPARNHDDRFLSTLAYGWFRAEAAHARLPHERVDLARWLAQTPRPESVRALAAYAFWASVQPETPEALGEYLDEIQTLLEAHENWLPIRSAWMTRSALARLAQGDVLGLVRTRDRLLDRLLNEGLSLDLDTPSFLRFASEGVSQRFQHVRDWIIKKREPIHEWVKKFNTGGTLQGTGVDAEFHNTHAYIDLILAWGLARFGEHQACERLRSRAAKILNLDDPVHRFLHAAFEYRIQQVREGKPAKGSLPAELHSDFRDRLEGLSIDPRTRAEYVVEKLLEHSDILVPTYKVDVYWKTTYQSYFAKSPIPNLLNELVTLEGTELNEAVLRLLPQIRPDAGMPGWMIVERLLEVTPKLEEKVAHEILSRVPAAVEEASQQQNLPRKLLDKGMLTAAHFNDQSLIKTLAARFLKYSEKHQDRKSLQRVEQLAQGTFRSFTRLGMKAELEKFLSHLAEWVLRGESFPVARRRFGKEWSLALRILLPVAAGWYHHGLDDQAYTILDLTGKDLYTVEMTPRERTDLALSYASTLGRVPVKIALGRFEEMFQRLQGIQLKGTTNTHFTLSILQLVETVVVSLVHPDFQLGPGVRRWLDEDEFLVRQRIHRDLKEVMT